MKDKKCKNKDKNIVKNISKNIKTNKDLDIEKEEGDIMMLMKNI